MEKVLTQYIRNSKNQKVGVIQSYLVVDDKTNVEHVFIVHSKTHSKKDKFNENIMWGIIRNRLEYMRRIIFENETKRLKFKKPFVGDLKKTYDKFLKRSNAYFKNAGMFHIYPDLFEYCDLSDEE